MAGKAEILTHGVREQRKAKGIKSSRCWALRGVPQNPRVDCCVMEQQISDQEESKDRGCDTFYWKGQWRLRVG